MLSTKKRWRRHWASFLRSLCFTDHKRARASVRRMFSWNSHSRDQTTSHPDCRSKPAGTSWNWASMLCPSNSASGSSSWAAWPTDRPKACCRALTASSHENLQASRIPPMSPVALPPTVHWVTPRPNCEASEAKTTGSHGIPMSHTSNGINDWNIQSSFFTPSHSGRVWRPPSRTNE